MTRLQGRTYTQRKENLLGKPPSRRQLEILQVISEGFTGKGAAHKLGIAHQTVKNHMDDLKAKLGVIGLPQAIAIAFRKGWIK
jgi:DNA-binding NarL/FixJ family response regulator